MVLVFQMEGGGTFFTLLFLPAQSNVFEFELRFLATSTPFTVNVNLDADEVLNTAGITTAIGDEAEVGPGGIVGFRMCYAQDTTC